MMKPKTTLMAVLTAAALGATTIGIYAEPNTPIRDQGGSHGMPHGQSSSSQEMGSQSRTKDSRSVQLDFKQMDANGDGTISVSEAAVLPSLTDDFKSADRNGDSKLNLSEYKQYVESKNRSERGRQTPAEDFDDKAMSPSNKRNL